MAAGFLSRWLRRAPAPSPEVTAAVAELQQLAHDRPTLAPLANLLGDLLPDLFGTPETLTPPALDREHAEAKLASGIPLLRGATFELDGRRLRERWKRVCAAVSRYQDAVEGDRLAEAVRKNRLDPAQLVRAVVAGQPEDIAAQADICGCAPDQVAAVLRLTAFPALRSLQDRLQPFVHQQAWSRGYCPICGNRPLLGEFRGLEQNRYLRCGWCAGEWHYPRLSCPFCGNRDYRALLLLNVEEEGTRFQAAACQDCRGYVKMIATLSALSPPGLLVADLASLHLDLIATNQGYSGTPNGRR